MRCVECGNEMKSRVLDSYKYAESGLDNVYLSGATEYRCDRCKLVEVDIPTPIMLHIVIALALSEKPAHLNGNEIKFMRKEVGMTGKAFAKLLKINSVTLSKWENDEMKHTDSHDVLIRYAFLLAMQHRLHSMIDNLLMLLKRARIYSLENKRLNIKALDVDLVSIFGNISGRIEPKSQPSAQRLV